MGESSTSNIGLSVLVVEDDADTRDSLAILLRMSGHAVRVAREAASAWEHITSAAPDVVMLDIGLPGIDGYEFARQLRSKSWERRPFLIAVTGYGTAEAKDLSFQAGIDLHCTKPIDPAALNSLLRNFEQITRYALPNGFRRNDACEKNGAGDLLQSSPDDYAGTR